MTQVQLGFTDGGLREVRGVAVDPAGYVYAADAPSPRSRALPRIYKFTPELTYLGSWGDRGVGPGKFGEPVDVEADARNNIYVVDKANNAIQIFSYLFGPGPAS